MDERDAPHLAPAPKANRVRGEPELARQTAKRPVPVTALASLASDWIVITPTRERRPDDAKAGPEPPLSTA